MTTLFRQAGAEDNWRVYMIEDATLTPKQAKSLGDADGLCGGPEENPGEYVPVRPEHSAELRAAAANWKPA